MAEEIAGVLEPMWVGRDMQWGLDHGTWSVLAHVYPDADVPVLQLSINALQPLDYHLELGRRRALTVRNLLVAAGLDGLLIEVGSLGEEDPLVETADETSEPLNRRVEVVIR